jgi:HTH-type transcriptional regulator / antitoxin HipB
MVKIFVRTPRDIGSLIRSRRRALGLGQAELAQRVGTSRLWITEIEKGKPRASLELVLRTLSILGLELTTDDAGKHQMPLGDAVAIEMLRRQA